VACPPFKEGLSKLAADIGTGIRFACSKWRKDKIGRQKVIEIHHQHFLSFSCFQVLQYMPKLALGK
jgi:hypothetical protein